MEEISSVLQKNQQFIISSHVTPDCDSLGSELGLAGYLQSIGKTVQIINSDATPENYQFIDPQQLIEKYDPQKHDAMISAAEVVVVVDASGGWARLGDVGEALGRSSAMSLCIDHHPDPVDFVDVAWVDVDAPATAQMVYDLITASQGAISFEMAQAMYAGIYTDSGGFRFRKTSPHTHNVVANLLECGIDQYLVYHSVYEQSRLGRIRMKGHLQATLQLTANGQVAYYGLTNDFLKQQGLTTDDTNGLGGLGLDIKGVRVSVYVSQVDEGQVKISLRTDNSIAINHIAAMYGGGGHAAAAGATVEGTVDKILPEVVKHVEAAIAAQSNSSTS